jgi:UDP-3-O-[3-hydroxymyristoyl] glucosamine N-acyltransferase
MKYGWVHQQNYIKEMKSNKFLEYGLIYPEGIGSELVLNVGSPKNQHSNNFYWLKSEKFYSVFKEGFLIIKDETYKKLKENNDLNENINHLITNDSPRYIFAKIVTENFSHLGLVYGNEVSYYKEKYKQDVTIGENVYIGKDVVIGKGTKIYNNTVIHNNTFIGERCVIKENCVIGSEGMGYEFNDDKWFKFPQIGKTVIGNDVEINTFCDIKRGALEDTTIGNGCKIGSFCNIGHNVKMDENCLLTSHCVIAGSAKIGPRFWMGINSSIKNGVTIGSDVTLGANSFIRVDVGNSEVVKNIN